MATLFTPVSLARVAAAPPKPRQEWELEFYALVAIPRAAENFHHSPTLAARRHRKAPPLTGAQIRSLELGPAEGSATRSQGPVAADRLVRRHTPTTSSPLTISRIELSSDKSTSSKPGSRG